MKPFNREKFLLWTLAGLLAWQAAIFSYGVVLCSRVSPQTDISVVCPGIGGRFDKFVQTTLGAVLGLLAGAAAISTTQRQSSSSDDRDESSVSPLPQRPQLPSPESSSEASHPPQGRGQTQEQGGRKP